jgi:NADP-dependent alcohol dehydrogenase
MNNFEFYNPTRIIFGKGTISEINNHIPEQAKVLMCYGGGSIKTNGVYEQVISGLGDRKYFEFGGIEPNPDYDTLMKAIELGRQENVDFILAVGGGSVLDGGKLIAAGIPYDKGEVWEIVAGGKGVKLETALPIGTVLTLPATGSEMNGNSVISRRATRQKVAWASELVFPSFSVLDPTTSYSLPENQVRNGIVDAYVHVVEQYITYPVNAPLQDRQAEGIFLVLHEIGEKALEVPPEYEARANLMWTATNALNKLICKGVPEDWATHMIGHEITALYGLAHAEALAVLLPHLLWYKREKKAEKLVQYGQRVWGLSGDDENVIRQAIEEMSAFFNRLKMPTKLTDYGIDPHDAASQIQARFEARGSKLGEHKDITPKDVAAILRMSQ